VLQFVQCGTTGLAPGGGIVTSPTEEREEPAAGILSGRRNRRPPCVQLRERNLYGTIDARPNIIIMGRVGIGFGGR
jgi:hypothetical protein